MRDRGLLLSVPLVQFVTFYVNGIVPSNVSQLFLYKTFRINARGSTHGIHRTDVMHQYFML